MIIRVNADYESELFFSQPRGSLNSSLEFLSFFATDEILYSQIKYDSQYLDYVEFITGKKPRITTKGEYINWWGPLINLELERWLNSKITSAELVIEEGWCSRTQIIKTETFPEIHGDIILKDPFGMSGQGLKKNGKSGKPPFIIEPFLDRVYDFSTFFFPGGEKITYQNFVDDKFQYRGTLINDNILNDVPQVGWASHDDALKTIQSRFQQVDWPTGFSVDSFIYREAGEFKIRSLCEINYRRTMGSTTFEMVKRLNARPWSLLTLGKGSLNLGFDTLKGLADEDIIMLSPGNTRYHIFLLHAEGHREGQKLNKRLSDLLPNCQFAINF